MDINQAYKTLDVSQDISDDDLKKIYKELAKKHHPDISKDADTFKKINEAYQLITDYRENPEKYAPQQSHGFWNNISISDLFVNIGFEHDSPRPAAPSHIQLSVDISFHESVTGCTKEITYKRKLKCLNCDGTGTKKVGNGCSACDGFGRVTTNNKGMIFQSSCAKCFGKNVKANKCEKCDGKRYADDTREGSLTIPPGTKNGDMLRLVGEGNFAQRGFFGDAYTDVFVSIGVQPHPSMYLKDADVYSTTKLTLLEALQGTTKGIDTVYGNKEITIKPGSRHSEEIRIPGCGVKSKNGMHVVQLDIDYPKDLSKLIDILKDSSNG